MRCKSVEQSQWWRQFPVVDSSLPRASQCEMDVSSGMVFGLKGAAMRSSPAYDDDSTGIFPGHAYVRRL